MFSYNNVTLSVKCFNTYAFTDKVKSFMHSEVSRCLFEESVQFSRSVMSDSLRPRGLQHARLHCPSSLIKLMFIESVMPAEESWP